MISRGWQRNVVAVTIGEDDRHPSSGSSACCLLVEIKKNWVSLTNFSSKYKNYQFSMVLINDFPINYFRPHFVYGLQQIKLFTFVDLIPLL